MDIGGLANAISGAAGISPNNLVGILSVGAMVINRVPGLEMIREHFHGLNLDFGTLTTWFMFATALWTGSMFLWNHFWAFVEEHYTCRVRLVSSHGPINTEFYEWLCDVKGEELRSTGRYDVELRVAKGTRSPNPYQRLFYQIAPDVEYRIRHNGHIIRVTRTLIKQFEDDEQQITTLSTYGRNHDVLRGLLQEVIDYSGKGQEDMTNVFGPCRMDEHSSNASWWRTLSRPKRPISSVVLEDEQKNKIVSDVAEYLLPQTSTWYANRGLPYRRGYLLYGPPGTGKTSLSMALAGHFGLSVYTLSLTHRGLTDENLCVYFSLLPVYCIILLEDIDASGVRRANDSIAPIPMPSGDKNSNTPAGPPPGFDPNTFKPKTQVTFSGLINAIDGATACEGRILIMTTNHREHLDEALIRPGRVDLQIAFSYASRPVITGIFTNLYDVSGDDMALLNYIPADFPEKEEVAEMAERFADMVPEGRFTPAEVQGLLLFYKKDPRKALEMTPAWVERRLLLKEENEKREKVAKASVDSS